MTGPRLTIPASIEQDPLEALKRRKPAAGTRLRTPVQDPLEQLKRLRAAATSADPNAQLHADYESGALQRRTARLNQNDVEEADAVPVSIPEAFARSYAATGASFLKDIPGAEAAQAGARSVVRGQSYEDALKDIRGNEDIMPAGTRIPARLAGAAISVGAAAPFIPAGALASGAIVGGAHGLAEADPVSPIQRAYDTAGGAIGGAAAGGAMKVGGAVVKKVADATGVTEGLSRGATELAKKLPIGRLRSIAERFGSSSGARGNAAEQIESRLESERGGADAVAQDVDANMAAMPKPELLADYSPEASALTKSVTKVPGPGRAAVTRELTDRAGDTAPRLSRDLAKVTTEKSRDARGVLEDLAETRERTAAAKFPKAYAAGANGIADPDIQEILSRPTFAKLYQKAQTMAGDEGRALPTQTVLKTPPAVQQLIENTKPDLRPALIAKLTSAGALVEHELPIPDVKTIHYVDRALRRAIEEGFDGKGPIVDPGHATELSKVFDDLRGKMAARVPEFADALASYSKDSGKIEALQTGLKVLDFAKGKRVAPGAMQAGESLTLKAGRQGIDGLEAAVAAMTPTERALFRQGSRTALFDELAGAEPNAAGSTQAMVSKVFGQSRDAQRWHDLLFKTPAEAEAFRKQLAREARMRATNAKMGGSDTAENLNERAEIVGQTDTPMRLRDIPGRIMSIGEKKQGQEAYAALGERLSASGTRLKPMIDDVVKDAKARRLRMDLVRLVRNAGVADATKR